ncbi:MAG TPA: TolC family protein [Puia sp.]|nr:TolC family protein [Puia sp.]
MPVHQIVIRNLLAFFLLFYFSENGFCQSKNENDSIQTFTLSQCVDYALQHQPFVNQALINIDIAHTTNSINLSGWQPQANISANLTHYNTLPTAFIKNAAGQIMEQRTGVINSAAPILSVTQTIFTPALLYAVKSANLYIDQAKQITDSAKINVVANTSKTFYSLLLTLEQIDVFKEDTARLAKNMHDTYHQYVSGIVDETDYDEAAISLTNSTVQLKQATESVTPQYALLKQIMGFPPEKQFNISYDTTRMMNEISFDTTQALQYQNRIEYKVLQTSKKLQGQLIHYYQYAWLPSLGAFFDYDLAFQNNSFGSLFANSYPYSYIGLSLNVPLFTGFARVKNLHRANLQLKLLDWDEVSLRSQIYSDYTAALANYKSNEYNLHAMKDNMEKAKRVYDIVTLQYSQGVVAYLNVITAEANLITSELGYKNALLQVLSSKIDLEKAMGFIVVH